MSLFDNLTAKITLAASLFTGSALAQEAKPKPQGPSEKTIAACSETYKRVDMLNNAGKTETGKKLGAGEMDQLKMEACAEAGVTKNFLVKRDLQKPPAGSHITPKQALELNCMNVIQTEASKGVFGSINAALRGASLPVQVCTEAGFTPSHYQNKGAEQAASDKANKKAAAKKALGIE